MNEFQSLVGLIGKLGLIVTSTGCKTIKVVQIFKYHLSSIVSQPDYGGVRANGAIITIELDIQ